MGFRPADSMEESESESRSIKMVDVVDAKESLLCIGFLFLDLLSFDFIPFFWRWNPKARAQARMSKASRMTAITRERMVNRNCSLSSIKSVTTWMMNDGASFLTIERGGLLPLHLHSVDVG